MHIVEICKSIYQFIDNHFLEPIFLSFAFFIIFTHIQDVFNAQGRISIANFWGQLKTDIDKYPWVYIPFLLVFLWWLASRVFKSRRDSGVQRRIEANGVEIANLIKRNTQALERNTNLLAQALENDGKRIPKKRRYKINRRNSG